MKKAILISIRPQWCHLIANGKKTIEIRKKRPKLETPFKCYIYCTKEKQFFFHGGIGETLDSLYRLPNGEIKFGYSGEMMLQNDPYTKDNFLNGKVIGEFTCKKITYLGNVATDPWEKLLGSKHEEIKKLITEKACLTEKEILKYKGRYGWDISELKIYEKPMPLNHIVVKGECDYKNCKKCEWFSPGNGYNTENDCILAYDNTYGEEVKPLFNAPQSWCYVIE